GISPSICQHAINMDDDAKPVVEHQRRLIPKMKEVVRNEVLKLLEAGIIYPIADSRWVSPVHCVPKKGGMTVVPNDNDELIPQRVVVGYRMCIDFRKVNKVTKKDHYPLPFIDQMLERLSKNTHFCFLDGYSGFSQIAVKAKDQEKTTFTCPYGTYAYRRMPFGLCNAPATFQRCMSAIFHGFCESIVEVFMDDFSVYGNSFDNCLRNLDKVLQRCEETNLVLNWEKCHFMVNEGIVLGHKIYERGIEVDRAKVEAIEKMPYPRDVKGIRSVLGHAGFYRRFIKDFSKISKPLTNLLQKDQRSNNGKEGLGFSAKAKKSNKNKAKPAQEKKKVITNGEAPKGKTINDDDDYAAGGSKWVLDSGCTNHMTGGKNLVKELRPNIHEITVSFGDNSTSDVLGFGKVVVAQHYSCGCHACQNPWLQFIIRFRPWQDG
ncbi:hypothetical protein QYE76_040821, partial [Lolium multiflorum]